jgi:hypothetical protein
LHRGLLIGRVIRYDHTSRRAEVGGPFIERAESGIDGVVAWRAIKLIESAACRGRQRIDADGCGVSRDSTLR